MGAVDGRGILGGNGNIGVEHPIVELYQTPFRGGAVPIIVTAPFPVLGQLPNVNGRMVRVHDGVVIGFLFGVGGQDGKTGLKIVLLKFAGTIDAIVIVLIGTVTGLEHIIEPRLKPRQGMGVWIGPCHVILPLIGFVQRGNWRFNGSKYTGRVPIDAFLHPYCLPYSKIVHTAIFNNSISHIISHVRIKDKIGCSLAIHTIAHITTIKYVIIINCKLRCGGSVQNYVPVGQGIETRHFRVFGIAYQSLVPRNVFAVVIGIIKTIKGM